MDWDEARATAQPAMAVGDNLATLSVGELEGRIVAFEKEIARIKEELARKRAHEAAASALFKS